MSKNGVGACSPQKLFVTRVQQLQWNWLTLPGGGTLGTPGDDAILRRLGADVQMKGAWERLAELSERDFEWFIEQMLYGLDGIVNGVPRARENTWKLLEQIGWAERAFRLLKDFCLAVPVAQMQFLSEDDPRHGTVAEEYPDVPQCLGRVADYLFQCGCGHADELRNLQQSRKASSDGGRTEFMRQMAGCTRLAFGKPHYEMVAAIVNVIFDADDQGGVSADAVRKAAGRIKPDYSPG